MKYRVFDKQGKEVFHTHAVDAKEAIASGNFFAENPVKPVPVAPAITEPGPVTSPGEDIEPITDEPENEVEQPEAEPPAPAPEVEEVETGKKRQRKG